MELIEQYLATRRTSTPLVGIRTLDIEALRIRLSETIQETKMPDDPKQPAPGCGKEIPILFWDAIRGLQGVNRAGVVAARQVSETPSSLSNPYKVLDLAVAKMPAESVLFMANVQMFMVQQNDTTALIVQAIYNAREELKKNRRQLVLLGPWFVLPPEINQDVTVLEDPLPSDEQLKVVVQDVYEGAGRPLPPKKVVDKAVDALRGLAPFAAEQVTAMSLSRTGLDMEMLWERKRQTIEQTPGLSIWRGGESFDGIKGVENAERYIKLFFDGKNPPKGVMFMDEMEKHLAGSTGGDLSGVKQDMLGALLIWMQDRRARGVLFIGVPGSAKSALAKAAGNYGQVPTISFDLAGMQESLVGKSGQNIRNGLKVVDAVTSGQALVIATCNNIQSLPPELRRRFKRGTFFFDLPNKTARKAIWELYMGRYGLPKQALPNDVGWTGAEIENCCETAADFGCSLIDAANFIVPVSRSAAASLKMLREMADGTFIDASVGGVYQYREEQEKEEIAAMAESKAKRKITLQ